MRLFHDSAKAAQRHPGCAAKYEALLVKGMAGQKITTTTDGRNAQPDPHMYYIALPFAIGEAGVLKSGRHLTCKRKGRNDERLAMPIRVYANKEEKNLVGYQVFVL